MLAGGILAVGAGVLALGTGANWYRSRHSDTQQATPSKSHSTETAESETKDQQPTLQDQPQRDPETGEFVRQPDDNDQNNN